MSLDLSPNERAIAAGRDGDGAAMAMRIVAEAGRLLGARRLIPIQSAHIDGALYHGDSGTLFAEKLVAGGAQVSVRSTLNVGALDLMGCSRVRLEEPQRTMARRMMDAYRKLGCEQTWTCAPYQAGHRPQKGTDVAWGESNAVVFCNSVLGARTNRYGDFLDIACAISGLAPGVGLHRSENRRAQLVFDVSGLSTAFLQSEIAWPILGTLYGRETGSTVGVVVGLPQDPSEDRLKAFGAAAASSGAVGLFHMRVSLQRRRISTLRWVANLPRRSSRSHPRWSEAPGRACRRPPNPMRSTQLPSAVHICQPRSSNSSND